ncbi:Os07g0631950, partial [Oryza sativa Japonica Group]
NCSTAAPASSAVDIVTNPKPRLLPVCLNLYLDHLNGAGLLEEPRELRAVDAERKVTNKHLEVLGELPLGLRATLLLLHLRRHRDGHGRKPPPQRRRWRR